MLSTISFSRHPTMLSFKIDSYLKINSPLKEAASYDILSVVSLSKTRIKAGQPMAKPRT